MFRRRPDLIVPIHDRRQRRRILTLKNFGIFVVLALIAFVGVSIRSEMRGLTPRGDYGRLFRSEIPQPAEAAPMEVVKEAAPVDDQTRADPMLVEPMARAQWLQDDVPTTATIVPAQPEISAASVAHGTGDVTIVGGTEGVTIVRSQRRKPVLSGGFGRPN